ncbi:MAG: PLP-dependent aminotransferase family protein [Clostridia bacterium]|nr:PLP-dependent aminotransferase family protein [Clostridia bacterium]MDY2901521.1 PLP-dependent aminotransferase family protein [Christensenellaceae bacterium]
MKKKYAVIYENLRKNITDGTIKFGEKLPSKRTAADGFGASVITVEHAYELLESEGYIESKPRRGYFARYVAEGILAENEFDVSYQKEFAIEKRAAVVGESAKDANAKDANANAKKECFPFGIYASAVRAVLNDLGDKITEKTDGSGTPALKSAIKNYLKTSRDVHADENRIIIGAGAEYLYGVIAKLFGAGETFAIESPSYGIIEKIYSLNGVKTEKLRLGTDGVLSEDLAACRARVIHVTPYRSFPTGVTASASKRAEYLRAAKKIGAYIVEDDYESEFSLSAKLTETLFKNTPDDNVIYINTFSKSVFPSLRLAYMILPEKLAAKYYEKFEDFSCPVPTLEQYVAAKIISDGSFARHVNRVRRARKKDLKINT